MTVTGPVTMNVQLVVGVPSSHVTPETGRWAPSQVRVTGSPIVNGALHPPPPNQGLQLIPAGALVTVVKADPVTRTTAEKVADVNLSPSIVTEQVLPCDSHAPFHDSNS